MNPLLKEHTWAFQPTEAPFPQNPNQSQGPVEHIRRPMVQARTAHQMKELEQRRFLQFLLQDYRTQDEGTAGGADPTAAVHRRPLHPGILVRVDRVRAPLRQARWQGAPLPRSASTERSWRSQERRFWPTPPPVSAWTSSSSLHAQRMDGHPCRRPGAHSHDDQGSRQDAGFSGRRESLPIDDRQPLDGTPEITSTRATSDRSSSSSGCRSTFVDSTTDRCTSRRQPSSSTRSGTRSTSTTTRETSHPESSELATKSSLSSASRVPLPASAEKKGCLLEHGAVAVAVTVLPTKKRRLDLRCKHPWTCSLAKRKTAGQSSAPLITRCHFCV